MSWAKDERTITSCCVARLIFRGSHFLVCCHERLKGWIYGQQGLPDIVMSLDIHLVESGLFVGHVLTGVRHLQHDTAFHLNKNVSVRIRFYEYKNIVKRLPPSFNSSC